MDAIIAAAFDTYLIFIFVVLAIGVPFELGCWIMKKLGIED